MDKSFLEILNAKIEEYRLMEYRTQITANAQECFILESTEPDHYKDVGNSRLGGIPDLPEDVEWPTSEGEHLIFLGQINFRDIQGINPDLPREGIIYLFLGNNETASDVETKILYCPDESKARKGELLEDYTPMYEDEDNVETPHKVKFTKSLSLSGYCNDLVETMGLSDEDLDTYVKMVSSLEDPGAGSHQVFGHIHYLNKDPRKYAPKKSDQTEWIFFMHLGWDKKVGFCFWDAGDLVFLVDKQSLLAGNFNTVFSCIETM